MQFDFNWKNKLHYKNSIILSVQTGNYYALKMSVHTIN